MFLAAAAVKVVDYRDRLWFRQVVPDGAEDHTEVAERDRGAPAVVDGSHDDERGLPASRGRPVRGDVVGEH
jgi:hypothetical protein